MKEVRGGWIAFAEGEGTFNVEGQQATGIYLNLTRAQAHLYFAGVDGDANEGMTLPSDPALLKDLAKVMKAAAKALEKTDYPWLHPL